MVSAQLCQLSSLPQSSEPSVFILIHLTPHPPTPNLPASTLMWGSGSQWDCSSDLALGLTSVWKPGGTAQSVKSREKSDSLPSPPICRGFSCFHNTFPACDLRRFSQPIFPEKKAKTNEMTCSRSGARTQDLYHKIMMVPCLPLTLPPSSLFLFFLLYTNIYVEEEGNRRRE